MLEDKNDIRLLYQSIQELASEMGQSQLNTKTDIFRNGFKI